MFYIQKLCFSSVLSLLSFFRVILEVTFWNDQILFATIIVLLLRAPHIRKEFSIFEPHIFPVFVFDPLFFLEL